MDADLEKLEAFIKEQGDTKQLPSPDADLFEVLEMDGDDCSAFLEAYSRRFNVDMSGFLWYFHHGEEGYNLGAFFVKPPYWRVKRIPITINLLLDSMGAGRWTLEYPPHTLPKRRWDTALSPILFVALLILFAVLADFVDRLRHGKGF